MEKRKFLTLPGLELRLSVVQPVADYAIPVSEEPLKEGGGTLKNKEAKTP
jgi:hypothetical protein